jgi:protein-disulfide isomerase
VATRSFSVTYDYLCPFAKNMHLHLVAAERAGAPIDVTYVPWSLHQPHKAEGDPEVWDDPSKYDALSALAASISVRDQQPEVFLDVHDALFLARHVHQVRLADFAEVATVLKEAGADVEKVSTDIATGRPYQVLAAHHADMAKVACFGVPTFVLGDAAVFVRYMTAPDGNGAESVRVIEKILDLIEGEPLLNEFKYTKVPH